MMLKYFILTITMVVTVNGNENEFGIFIANLTKYSYHVTIEYEGVYICNGAILAANYAITSAQCINVDVIESIKVRAGTNLLETGGSLHQVEDFETHNYKFGENDKIPTNDFAVLYVKEPFKFDSTRQPITIYENRLTESDIVHVTSWSFNNSPRRKGSKLRVANVPFYGYDDKCSSIFEEEGGVHQDQFCVGLHNRNGLDTCPLDIGAVAVVKGQIAGILSHAYPHCPISPKPEIYTDLSEYKSIIYNYAGIYHTYSGSEKYN